MLNQTGSLKEPKVWLQVRCRSTGRRDVKASCKNGACIHYHDSTNWLETPKKILKVNHAGEFGAICIYRGQLPVGRALGLSYVPVLESFLADETRHLEIFWKEIQRRGGVKCKSYWLCGVGGWYMGFASALFGKTGVKACTWAVESVVTEHAQAQLVYLESKQDAEAYEAVSSILKDEANHRDLRAKEGGTTLLYAPLRFCISPSTHSNPR